MRTIIFLMTFIGIIFFNSCSNEDLDSMDNTSPVESPELIKFIYKNKLYSSTYFMSIDSLIILDDNEANKVYQVLGQNADLATVLYEDDVYEYYDNYNDMVSHFVNIESSQPNLRIAGPKTFTVEMYEDSSWNGKKISFTVTETNPHIDIPNFGVYNMNKKISSLRYRSVVGEIAHPPMRLSPQFTLFTGIDYTGRSITFVNSKWMSSPSNTEEAVRRLKDVKVAGSSDNWNDRVHSAKIGKMVII